MHPPPFPGILVVFARLDIQTTDPMIQRSDDLPSESPRMPAALRFRCYHCHRVHTVDEAAVGRKGRCVCGKLMVVPAPLDPAAAGEGYRALPLAMPPLGGEGRSEVVLSGTGATAPPPVPPPAHGGDGGSGRTAPPSRGGGGIRAALEETTAARPPPVAARKKGPSRMSGTIYVILSLFALAGWVLHQFFTGESPPGGVKLVPTDPNYLTLPAAFWSTVLFALFLALALEGIHRVRAAER
jgi:hypothetical protein